MRKNKVVFMKGAQPSNKVEDLQMFIEASRVYELL